MSNDRYTYHYILFRVYVSSEVVDTKYSKKKMSVFLED